MAKKTKRPLPLPIVKQIETGEYVAHFKYYKNGKKMNTNGGKLTDIEAIKILNIAGYSEQYVFKTQKAIDSLHFLSIHNMSKEELEEYREKFTTERHDIIKRTEELKERFYNANEREGVFKRQ